MLNVIVLTVILIANHTNKYIKKNKNASYKNKVYFHDIWQQ